MGLDTTHDCWHGSYSGFMRWRQAVAAAAGLPELERMEGYGGDIAWDQVSCDPALKELLNHSDCDGEIPAHRCKAVAVALEAMLPHLEDSGAFGHRSCAVRFIRGLRAAAERGEAVEFR